MTETVDCPSCGHGFTPVEPWGHGACPQCDLEYSWECTPHDEGCDDYVSWDWDEVKRRKLVKGP